MLAWLSIVIALTALFISCLTFYYSRLKRGRVKMTKPTTIFFGPDGVNMEHTNENKIHIRTLLYSTSDRGQYIENMYIRLQRGEVLQNFNIWVYGDNTLCRGSGLFVGKAGISSNHHFQLPKDGSIYEFLPGDYHLEVFVETINHAPYKIFEQMLSLSTSQYDEMIDKGKGVYYDWFPNTQTYHPYMKGVRKKDIVLPNIF